MTKPKISITPAIIVLSLIGIVLAGMTVPISNNNDIFLTVIVEKPACQNILCTGDTPANITDIIGYATSHTLIESPYLADILSSGSLKLSAETTNKKTIKFIGTLYKGTSGTYQLSIRDVPPSQTNVTVKLYETNTIVATKYVNIISGASS